MEREPRPPTSPNRLLGRLLLVGAAVALAAGALIAARSPHAPPEPRSAAPGPASPEASGTPAERTLRDSLATAPAPAAPPPGGAAPAASPVATADTPPVPDPAGPLAGDAPWAPGAPLFGLAFDPAGSRLFSAGRDGRVMCWEVPSGRLLREWPAQPAGGGRLDLGRHRLATVGDDEVLRVWDHEGRLVREIGLQRFGFDVALSPDEATAVVSFWDDGDVPPHLMVYDLDTGREPRRIDLEHDIVGIVGHMAFDAAGSGLFVSRGHAPMRLDLATGRPGLAFELAAGHGAFEIAVSPDRRHLAALLANLARRGPAERAASGEPPPRQVVVWSAASAAPTRVPAVSSLRTQAVQVLPGGRRVAVAGRERVEVWECATGEVLASCPARSTRPLAAGPHGRYVAWGDGGAIRLLDLAAPDGAPPTTPPNSPGPRAR